MNEMDRERGGYTSLQKIQVTCRTCGITESFYSNLSVDHFKLSHRGHDVVVVGDSARPKAPARIAQARASSVEEVAPEMSPEIAPLIEPELVEQPHMDDEGATRVAKVLVDTVMFPALSNPVLRIRGFTAELELAFVVSSSPGNSAKIRDVLARGEYLDEGSTGLRYVWDADVIEFEEGTRERLGLPAEAARSPPAQPEPEAVQIQPDMQEDTVAKTNEMLFGVPRMEEPEPIVEEVPPTPQPVPETPLDPLVEAFLAPTPEPPAPEVLEEPRAEPEPVEPPAPRRARPAKRAKKVHAVPEEAKPRPPEEKEQYLLVSKSWYVQGGSESKEEAVRISKVLKEFRWKVEPVYTIGVMLDDLLSIETSRSEITKPLIERIEEAGYSLTAVVVEQGKPVAWFKRGAEKTSRKEPREAKPSRSVEPDKPIPSEEHPTSAPESQKDAPPEEGGAFGILDLTEPVPDQSDT